MSKLFKATLIVTFFSVITRAFGFLMKVILSRSLTPTSLGEYQLAMSIFGVMLTLISSGLPLIISRKIAYYQNIGDTKSANKTTSTGLIISLFISVLFSIFLFIFKDSLEILFKSKSISAMVLSLIPALVFSSIYSLLRGSLWGQKKFFAISFSEFFEQIIRIGSLIILFIIPINADNGVKATLSLSIACICSSILVLIMYFCYGNKLSLTTNSLKPILKESTSITLARTASSIVSMLISFIIPLRLTTFGFSHSQALAEFGIVTGMALPLITIPGTFISSIAVALVPEISSQTTNIDKDANIDKTFLRSKISVAMNCTLILSFMLVPAFLSLGRPIGEIVFKNSRAGTFISAGSILMIFMGLNQICSSILNAIGLEIKSLKNYCAGAIALLFCIYFLPRFIGVMSLVVAMLSMSLISGLLSLSMLKKRELLPSNLPVNTMKLTIITIISSAITHFTYNLLFIAKLGMFISCAISGTISLISFFALCYSLNIATVRFMVNTKFLTFFKKKKA